MDFFKETLKHLIALRTNIITVIVIMVGGLYGLHLLQLPKLVYVSSLVAGCYFIYIFALNLVSINKEVYKILERLKND